MEVPFPINIDIENIIVHKIIVAHGAAEACQQLSDDNVSGSLAVAYGKDKIASPFPFMIDIDKDNPVHVFDSHTLPIIFGELDTVFDLSEYLVAKVAAISRFDLLTYCGEEDLLANYWLNYDKSKNCHFIGTRKRNVNGVMIGEGEWKGFIESDRYKSKKLADRESYLWDELIQRTCQNALDGTLQGNSDYSIGQSAIHEMAKELRFSRRALAGQMIKAIRDFPDTTQPITRNLSFMPSYYPEKGYVFLQIKMDKILDYENDYRPKRRAMLEIACAAAKNKFSHLRTVIGIAIDAPKFSKLNSEDFILMDCEDWPDDRREHYEKANEGVQFFTTANLVTTKKTVTEFPMEPAKTGKNDPCPCGSGKKYKKCCLGV